MSAVLGIMYSKVNENNEAEAVIEKRLAETRDSAAVSQIREMMQAGLVYGRKKSKTHPRMKKFIAMNRNGFELIDLEKTIALLDTALAAMRDMVQKNGTILFIDSYPTSKDLIKKLAEEFDFPYVTNRWLGGTLTNFKTISERIGIFRGMKEGRESGEFNKYTKKERLMIDRKLERMDMLFGGIEGMKSLPGMLFVVNGRLNMTALREARICNIPVTAIISTDTDPDTVTYPIPANDSSRDGIQWVLERVRLSIEEGRQKGAASSDTPSSPQPGLKSTDSSVSGM